MPFFISRGEAVAYMEDNPPCGTVKVCMTPDECFFGNPAFVMAYAVQTETLRVRFLRKVPFMIYADIDDYFRSRLPNEALVRIVLKDGKYDLIVPEEVSVSRTHVEVHAHRPEEGLLIAEIHSHNSMPAFWSSVDDADENDAIVYGVFGGIRRDETVPVQTKFRTFYKGACAVLSETDIFDFDNINTDEDALDVKDVKAYKELVKAAPKAPQIYFTPGVISEEVVRLRNKLGFTKPFSGKVNNKGFSLEGNKFMLKDRQKADLYIKKWEDAFEKKQTAETAAYFELAQTAKARIEAGCDIPAEAY